MLGTVRGQRQELRGLNVNTFMSMVIKCQTAQADHAWYNSTYSILILILFFFYISLHILATFIKERPHFPGSGHFSVTATEGLGFLAPGAELCHEPQRCIDGVYKWFMHVFPTIYHPKDWAIWGSSHLHPSAIPFERH